MVLVTSQLPTTISDNIRPRMLAAGNTINVQWPLDLEIASRVSATNLHWFDRIAIATRSFADVCKLWTPKLPTLWEHSSSMSFKLFASRNDDLALNGKSNSFPLLKYSSLSSHSISISISVSVSISFSISVFKLLSISISFTFSFSSSISFSFSIWFSFLISSSPTFRLIFCLQKNISHI